MADLGKYDLSPNRTRVLDVRVLADIVDLTGTRGTATWYQYQYQLYYSTRTSTAYLQVVLRITTYYQYYYMYFFINLVDLLYNTGKVMVKYVPVP